MKKLVIFMAAFVVGGCAVDPSAVDVTGAHVYFLKDEVRCVGSVEVDYVNPADGYEYAQRLEDYGDFYHWNTEGLPSGEYWVMILCRRGYDVYPSEIHFAPAQDRLDDESREWFVYGGEYYEGWDHRSFWYFAAYKDYQGILNPVR